MDQKKWYCFLFVSVIIGIGLYALQPGDIPEAKIIHLDTAAYSSAAAMAREVASAAQKRNPKEFLKLCANPYDQELRLFHRDLGEMQDRIDFDTLLAVTCYAQNPERKSLFFPCESGGRAQIVMSENNGLWQFHSFYLLHEEEE